MIGIRREMWDFLAYHKFTTTRKLPVLINFCRSVVTEIICVSPSDSLFVCLLLRDPRLNQWWNEWNMDE